MTHRNPLWKDYGWRRVDWHLVSNGRFLQLGGRHDLGHLGLYLCAGGGGADYLVHGRLEHLVEYDVGRGVELALKRYGAYALIIKPEQSFR